jgi:hypothetical protein
VNGRVTQRAAAGFALVALVAGAASCTSDPVSDPAADLATYVPQMEQICTDADAARQAVAEPVEDVGVAAYTAQIAAVLRAEADRARALSAPSDLDADHRAFVQNTDDQAAAWELLATTSPSETAEFGQIQTEILELTLGRNDLAADMGLDPGCLVGTG